MKKILVLSLLAVVLFTGCSKDKTESTYFVKFLADGTQKAFSAFTFGHIENVGGFTELSIMGANNSSADDNYIGIQIHNYPGLLPVITGAYEDSSPDFTLFAMYGVNDVEHNAGKTESEDALLYNIPNHQRLRVTITEITSTNIRGTFSGDYYENGDVQFGNKVRITNGEFNVRVQ